MGISCSVLVVYDSLGPQIEAMASALCEGIARVPGARTVHRPIRDASRDDLLGADGIILGSPNWSGVTGSLKLWLDNQGDVWEEGVLAGKVGAAFTTGRGLHSGLEFTLLSLIHWMMACGMVVVGLPWSEEMRLSGSYYGATAAGQVTPQDEGQARALGARVAEIVMKLSGKQGP